MRLCLLGGHGVWLRLRYHGPRGCCSGHRAPDHLAVFDMDVWADIIDCRRFVSLLPPLLLIFLVPRFGIHAYLAGSLISYIVMTVLEGIYLHPYMDWSIVNFFVIPCISLTILGTILKKLYLLIPVPLSSILTVSVIGIICLIICIGYLFVLQRLKCINIKDFL